LGDIADHLLTVEESAELARQQGPRRLTLTILYVVAVPVSAAALWLLSRFVSPLLLAALLFAAGLAVLIIASVTQGRVWTANGGARLSTALWAFGLWMLFVGLMPAVPWWIWIPAIAAFALMNFGRVGGLSSAGTQWWRLIAAVVCFVLFVAMMVALRGR
jgi:hypothetical protein